MEQQALVASSGDPKTQELEIVTYVLRVFQTIPQDSRRRVVDTVSRFFDLRSDNGSPFAPGPASSPSVQHDRRPEALPAFSEDRSISPKQFMFQKQPKTDVERVACLAYYLTHYRDSPYFKTLDLSTLNTEAAQVKFSNPSFAMENATKMGYLVPASKGSKQISAYGEQFVLALPDRDKAREVMNHARPKRKSRKDAASSLP